ncbi:MAG: glutamate-5-semialdehyde dehydrogenase [Breznakibacter sp.]
MNKVIQQLNNAKAAARKMVNLGSELSTKVLNSLADALVAATEEIMAANRLDLANMPETDPRHDRLMLTPTRIEAIASDVRSVARLPMPVGETLEERELENGLKLKKIRVPLGVVGVIFEARPNVTIDVFALALRSANVAVLKGGSDAASSNQKLVEIIHRVLAQHQLDTNIVQLLPPHRLAAEILMNAVDQVDVLIPRGSQSLINTVRQQAKVPVIETGAGIVHTYFDETADLQMGKRIIENAKTRRVSVCNALDCLIIHQDRLSDLASLAIPLQAKGVEIFADEKGYEALSNSYPDEKLHHASMDDYGREFLSLKMSVKTVSSLDEALDHIYRYSSRHSEAIISQDNNNIERFLNEVDAAAVYVNTSTAFTDGAQFGLGAEIGISTQKLHARGPMALRELTSYKWQITGNGQIRPA